MKTHWEFNTSQMAFFWKTIAFMNLTNIAAVKHTLPIKKRKGKMLEHCVHVYIMAKYQCREKNTNQIPEIIL